MRFIIIISCIVLILLNYSCETQPKKDIDLTYDKCIQNDSILLERYTQHLIYLQFKLFSDSLYQSEVHLYKEIEVSRIQLIDWLDAEERGYVNGDFYNDESYMEFNKALDRYYKLCSKEIYNDLSMLKPIIIEVDSSKCFHITRSKVRREIFNLEYLSLLEILFKKTIPS